MKRLPNPVCDPNTIAENIRKMGSVITGVVNPVLAKVEASKRGAPDLYTERSQARRAYGDMIAAGGPVLFQGILQQYDLPKALRSRIEAGSRFYMRRSVPSVPKVSSLLRLLRSYKAHYEAAKEAVRVGTPHSHCKVDALRELKAGPFRVINAGGFDKRTMDEVKSIVEDAAKRMAAKGLGAALYGDISVTNTLYRENVAAFYLPKYDDMFVRANRAGVPRERVVRTVIHELAHRYDHQVLKDERALEDIYDEIEDLTDRSKKDRAKAVLASAHAPRVGERVGDKQVWQVVDVSAAGAGAVVIRPVFKGQVSMQHRTKRVPLERYLAWKGTKLTTQGGFVTKYASTSARENFAEMIAYYCFDQLPANQVLLLKAILPSSRAPAAPASKAAAKPARPPRFSTWRGSSPSPSPTRKTPSAPQGMAAARSFASQLISTFGRKKAEAYALELATRYRTGFFVNVYASFLGRRAA